MNRLLLYRLYAVILLCTTSLYNKFNFLYAQSYISICEGETAQLYASPAQNYTWTPANSLNASNIQNPIASPTSTTTYYVTSTGLSGNLIWNGDFNNGNVGFSSAYTLGTGGAYGLLSNEGTYTVHSNANSTHSHFSYCSGHGGGNFMVVNGATISNQAVWCQTVNVTPYTNYQFSAWLASVHFSNPANLQFTINGVNIGNPLTASYSTCQWNQFFSTWNSGGNTVATICITNQNTNQGGNDFGLDDIEFRAITNTSSWTTVIVNPRPNPGIVGTTNICLGDYTALTGTGATSYSWSTGQTSPTIYVAPSVATTYSVTATNAYGCTASSSTNTTVNPKPVVGIVGSTSICIGDNTTLVGTGGTSYSWSTGQTSPTINVAPITATNYSVTATNIYGCTASTSINTTVNPLSTAPSLGAISGSHCPNTSMTLTAAGGIASTGSTIRWYTGPNGSGTLLNSGSSCTMVPTNGQTVYVRREGGCNTTVDDSITINLKDYIYALNGDSTSTYCTDDNGWHHFYQGDEILLSVRGDLTGAAVGFPRITIWDNGNPYQQTQGSLSPASCSNGWSAGEERFEMERSWNIDFGGGTLNPPYEVRFYYEPSERSAIENAALTHMSTYPACGYSYKYANPLGFYWFKNTGSNYTAPDYDGLHLTATGGTTPNGINYGEFSGITSFSGGGGALSLVPNAMLSTEWLYFKGRTDNTTNFLSWATEAEQNTLEFNVQRSQDGSDFQTIGTVAAKGSSTNANHYLFDDENPFGGANYYRLELLDTDGTVTYSNTILLTIIREDIGYSFYPNPTEAIVYYQYEASKKEKLNIEVLDVLGRQITSKEVNSQLGINNIPIDLGRLAVGAYVVRVNNGLRVHTTKVILK